MTETMKALNPPSAPLQESSEASQTDVSPGPYAAAIALLGIVLATGFALITGEGYWSPWNMLIGPLLLIVLWAVPIRWIGPRFGGTPSGLWRSGCPHTYPSPFLMPGCSQPPTTERTRNS